MPWPEQTLTHRILSGLVGAILGALLVFTVTLGMPYSWSIRLLLTIVACGAGVGFISGYWMGDPAIKGILRLIGRR